MRDIKPLKMSLVVKDMRVWHLDLHLLNEFASNLELDAMTSADAGSEVREDEKHLSILCVRKQCVL